MRGIVLNETVTNCPIAHSVLLELVQFLFQSEPGIILMTLAALRFLPLIHAATVTTEAVCGHFPETLGLNPSK